MGIFKTFFIDEKSSPLLYIWNNEGNDNVGKCTVIGNSYSSYGNILKKDNGVLTSICSFDDVNRNTPRWYYSAWDKRTEGASSIVAENPYCLDEKECIWDDTKAYDISNGFGEIFVDVNKLCVPLIFIENTIATEIPDFSNVEELPDYGLYRTFYNCTGLTGTPDFSSLKKVGYDGLYETFYKCTGLTGTPDLSGIEELSGIYCLSGCFNGCSGLTGSPTIPRISEIPDGAYQSLYESCSNIAGTAPDLSFITSIGSQSLSRLFYGCTKLTGQATLPSITEVPSYSLSYIYYNCQKLTGTMPDFSGLTAINTYGMASAFYACKLTGTPDFSNVTLLKQYGLSQTFYASTNISGTPKLPSVSLVDNYALRGVFRGCTKLTGVSDLSSYETINTYGLQQAFYGCTAITGTPDFSNIVKIDKYGLGQIFYNCSKLTGDVYFTSLDPTQVPITGTSAATNPFYQAFYKCTGIDSVHFPASLTDTQKSYLTDTVLFGGSTTTYKKATCQILFDI